MNRVGELAHGVIMAGITGTNFDRSGPRFGGYLLFGGDGISLQAIRSLTDSLRSDARAPLLIAIDQEGGRVARLRAGVEPMPAMMALGAADDIDLADRAGEQIAFDLRRAGCTLDFAPVLDLAIEPSNTVIGTRSFGADPQRVASLGVAFGKGLQRGGILACFKHFPGHGATAIDSHEALPAVDDDEATIRARDIVPFAAVAHEAPAMMSAHVVFHAFDAERPATLSPRIANDLLRVELGFRGAFVTDCLEMNAVAESGSRLGAVEALAAGADLLIFSHDIALAAAAAEAIELAVEQGHVALSRLEEAHERVSRLRETGSAPLPIDAFPPHPGIGREIGRRAITLLRGIPHADPLSSIAVSFGSERRVLEPEAPALEELLAPLEPSSQEAETLLAELEARERRPILLARRAHCHPSQAQTILRILERNSDALVVSVREPFDTALFPGARHVLAAYGDDVASIGGLADVIFGGSMPTGRLPTL
ncbi:MAG: beta-N-acetylhexosaminidase [Candidatus Cybelea sp.]